MLLRKYVISPLTRRRRHRSDDVEAERLLRSEIRVADLEREVAGMRPEEIELFERRIARRAREADGDRQLVLRGRRTEQQPDRS